MVASDDRRALAIDVNQGRGAAGVDGGHAAAIELGPQARIEAPGPALARAVGHRRGVERASGDVVGYIEIAGNLRRHEAEAGEGRLEGQIDLVGPAALRWPAPAAGIAA